MVYFPHLYYSLYIFRLLCYIKHAFLYIMCVLFFGYRFKIRLDLGFDSIDRRIDMIV
jgi:hypothetical protein